MIRDTLVEPLIARLTAFADDELILAHRNSEWVGHAPMLEEDIALANVAQDELGHAMLFYDMVHALGGPTGDTLAFFRSADQYRNTQFVELPKGDWAFTILRQYLFDAYQHVLYDGLVSSSYQPLADAAAKIRKEELYHLRHTHAWVHRLGLGSAEANRRMQAALDVLWPLAGQLFVPLAGDEVLVSAEIIPTLSGMQPQWHAIVHPHLLDSDLTPPPADTPLPDRTTHTTHLTDLLADMQLVARLDPDAVW